MRRLSNGEQGNQCVCLGGGGGKAGGDRGVRE